MEKLIIPPCTFRTVSFTGSKSEDPSDNKLLCFLDPDMYETLPTDPKEVIEFLEQIIFTLKSQEGIQ